MKTLGGQRVLGSGDPVMKRESQNKYSFLLLCNNDDNSAALFYDFRYLI